MSGWGKEIKTMLGSIEMLVYCYPILIPPCYVTSSWITKDAILPCLWQLKMVRIRGILRTETTTFRSLRNGRTKIQHV